MSRSLKIYIGFFVVLLIVLMINDYSKPKPIDWSPSFVASKKIPFGTYVLFKEMKTFFPKTEIEKIHQTPYECLPDYDNGYSWDTKNAEKLDKFRKELHTYFFLNDYLAIDVESNKKLLQFVEEGNTVFMVGNTFPILIEDSLKIKTKFNFSVNGKITLEMANKEVSHFKYKYKKNINNAYFSKIDTVNTTVLGYNNTDTISENDEISKARNINFIKVKYGQGYFILNTQPYAFTNYHMLKSNHYKYVGNCLSYLPNNKILWDEKEKVGIEEIDSDLGFIWSKPALKYAWLTGIFALILFAIFKAKRRQRIIPIIEKPKNSSIAFAKTIGDLYFQEGEPKDIVNKKITFFLEYIRNNYMLDTQNLNKEFIKRLSNKSGVNLDQINRLIQYIVRLNKIKNPSEENLNILTKMIDDFKEKTSLKK